MQESLAADSTVPEGGYGWVIVFASSILAWWAIGTPYSWGAIRAALVKETSFPPSTLSFVGSMAVACVAAFGLLNARIVQALGVRKTSLIGVLLLGIGQILSSFSTHNIGGLSVTIGTTVGLGMRYQEHSSRLSFALQFHRVADVSQSMLYGE